MLKISIILPNYNGEKYLEKAIQSFIDQDYCNKELIIVDGKSTDNSHNIIKRFICEKIIWINELDNGISNAFNIGYKYATGEIIGYLGSDDIIYKDLFQNIDYINSWSSLDAVYFNSYTFFTNEKKCILRKCPEIEFNFYNLLSYGTIVGWQNIYFKKEVYDKYKLDEKNKYSMDLELYLRICYNENLLIIKSDNISTINIFDNNISTDIDGKQMLEAKKVVEKYSNLVSYKGRKFGSIEEVKIRKGMINTLKNILKRI